MSKTTRRHGVPIVMRTTIDAHPKPSPEVLAQWAFLDQVANLLFGRRYFDLTSKVRTYVHELLKKAAPKSDQSDKHLNMLYKAKLLA